MRYIDYMIDYLIEESDTEDEEEVQIREPEEGHERVAVVESYFLQDGFQKDVNKILSEAGNIDKIIDYTGNFIDIHSKEFSAVGPIYNVPFQAAELKFFFDLFNTSKDNLSEILEGAIAEAYTGSTGKLSYLHYIRILPHVLLFTAILSYGLTNKDNDLVECSEYLIAFSFYPIFFRNYWPYGVKPNLMEYTIEDLTSKSVLRKSGTLLSWIKHHAHRVVESFGDHLVGRPEDSYYIAFTYRVKNQFNSAFKKLSEAYRANDQRNATQYNPKEKDDADRIIDRSSKQSSIRNDTESTYNNFISNGVDIKIANIVAGQKKLSKEKFNSYLNTILNDKRNRLYELLECIITLYYNSDPDDTSIGSGAFLAFGINLYLSIGTSKDDLRVSIKDILEFWTTEIVDIMAEYNRASTKIDFKRAFYNYIVIKTQKYNN